jgi:hypothetical protein
MPDLHLLNAEHRPVRAIFGVAARSGSPSTSPGGLASGRSEFGRSTPMNPSPPSPPGAGRSHPQDVVDEFAEDGIGDRQADHPRTPAPAHPGHQPPLPTRKDKNG